jgi:hypothetical protein
VVEYDTIEVVSKVKAHQVIKNMEEGKDKRWAIGNDRVDMAAKMAAKSAINMELADAYVQAQKAKGNKLRAIARRLGAQVFPETRRIGRNSKRVRQRDEKCVPEHLRHNFRWQGGKSKRNWVCEKCGIAKQRGTARCDKHACLGAGKIASKTHETHRTFIAWGTKSGAPVVHCVVCGYYGTTKCMGMQRACRGNPVNNTRHKRLMRDVHPHTKEPLWKRAPVPRSGASCGCAVVQGTNTESVCNDGRVEEPKGHTGEAGSTAGGECSGARTKVPVPHNFDDQDADWFDEPEPEGQVFEGWL